MDRRQHWDAVYETKAATDVSWYEAEPVVSLRLIETVAKQDSRIIDIGGGASLLVDRLLANGYRHVGVLDVSATAIGLAQQRLGVQAKSVSWHIADVTTLPDLGQYDVWHDRAVFHFLTSSADRAHYVELARHTLPAGGHLILGTFALDGPPKCSGLEVCRYDAHQLANELGAGFRLLSSLGHVHRTPTDKPQSFVFTTFQRV